MKQSTTKIIVLGGMLAASAQAYSAAATGCTTGTGLAITGSSTTFVKDSFTPKCSNGVSLGYYDQNTVMSVKAGSSKGMHTFGGNTDGGGIFQCESTSIPGVTAAPTAMLKGCADT